MRSRLFLFLRWGLVLALAFSAATHAQSAPPSEYELKAAFLYNFAKFIEWSGEARTAPEGNFMLCTVGDDPFGPMLAAVEGKLVRGQPLRLKRGVALEGLKACNMLFVPESEQRRLPVILKAVQSYPVATVSDIGGFAEAGGMIELVVADNRMQFDINLAPAHNANLKISSQLLKLARSVSGRKSGS